MVMVEKHGFHRVLNQEEWEYDGYINNWLVVWNHGMLFSTNSCDDDPI